ncbi:alpha-1,2-mannosidase, putative [Talaromyces stipitatus ATCC 10500]|uniref:Alpha-1,2-mannosidase, putative n=1 Tax=Talaromyces stipitatus (strain ATCC 10500 / CBS 375.48 / QM 6759 / NRRL 1006) TaxID=441959 RepID=B8MB98_TALSN|nr:alpha-1,2-mannosidase, putative [Talaromyces stipitatus ATCC 10500]EED18887.1 alpha-1,2-mannosidase, putative [Talaromyces stipitatus ATCC 10500]
MKINKRLTASILLAVSVRAEFDPLRFVDPLIGTNNGGNVFAGATLPYGMAKPVADVNGQNTGGFATDGSGVTGFSAMHDSGTGGNPSLGNFPIMPQICPDDVIDNCNFLVGSRAVNYDNASVKATPGYFGLKLVNGIAAEMTATRHAALYKFNFESALANSSGTKPLILLDLTDLWQSRQNATVSVDESSGRIRANGTFLPSFGAGSYRSFVCVDFAGGSVNDTGIWVNNRAGTVAQDLYVTRGFNNFYLEAGGFVMFDSLSSHTLYARVGVSLVSTEKACQNAEKEIPEPTSDFANIQSAAEKVWREKLSPVSVNATGVSEDFQKIFWSGIYRTMLSPQNYTGENPLWNSDEPYFDSYYCIWDAFRVQYPLLTIVDPNAQSQMVRSLVDIYKHEGWLPDCRMSLCKGWTQGGSNADVVLADAYVKNLTGIDWNLAYDALVNDAENEPLEWSIQGRGGLQSWKNLQYIPYLDFDYLGFGTNSRSISRTVEYAYNDYCVSVVGKGLGKTNLTKYLTRSMNWKNIFKADQTSFINGTDTGFVGFFQPRYLNGTWGFQDPIACSPLTDFCSLTSNPSETFESSVWEYQFYVPHDMSSLITTLGGPDEFISRLDYYYESGIADISNEPVFLSDYSYHYAGRPGLSTKRAHSYIPSSFNTSESGLPGNDDSGAMASFSIFSQLGLFPVAGQNVYLISSPFFESVNITHPETKKTATIRVKNFDPTYTDMYIMNATLDGQTYTKNWIGHEFFLKGQTLELTVGSDETASFWGKGVDDLPPSLSLSAQLLF